MCIIIIIMIFFVPMLKIIEGTLQINASLFSPFILQFVVCDKS